jgi:hypothetical protein
VTTDDEVLAKLDAWPPFSHRYGVSLHPLGPEHRPWWSRHLPYESLLRTGSPRVPEPWRCACTCPAPSLVLSSARCRQAATREDFFCDECRQYCADTADKAETITEAWK